MCVRGKLLPSRNSAFQSCAKNAAFGRIRRLASRADQQRIKQRGLDRDTVYSAGSVDMCMIVASRCARSSTIGTLGRGLLLGRCFCHEKGVCWPGLSFLFV